MGAGLALELLRHDPAAFERLALIAPATNWRAIIEHGVNRSGLPGFVAAGVAWVLESRVASRLVGMPLPLDFDRLDWRQGAPLTQPLLVVHSLGDEEIPLEFTRDFVAQRAGVALVETAAAPHGWEANVDPAAYASSLESWLVSSAHE